MWGRASVGWVTAVRLSRRRPTLRVELHRPRGEGLSSEKGPRDGLTFTEGLVSVHLRWNAEQKGSLAPALEGFLVTFWALELIHCTIALSGNAHSHQWWDWELTGPGSRLSAWNVESPIGRRQQGTKVEAAAQTSYQ